MVSSPSFSVPLSRTKTARLWVRVPAKVKRLWAEAAKVEGLSLSQWANQALVVKAETLAVANQLARTRRNGRSTPAFRVLRATAKAEEIGRVEDVAFHESGHAVCCAALDLPLRSVTIVPRGEFLGYFNYSRRGDFSRTKHLLVVDLAGYTAENRATKGRAWVGFGGDYENALEKARKLSQTPEEAVRLLKSASAQAEEIISDNWPAVCCVAKALIARKRLTGAQVRSIFAGSSKWARS